MSPALFPRRSDGRARSGPGAARDRTGALARAQPREALTSPPLEQERAARIRSMFDRVARRYDLLNELMSFGQHRRWRRLAAQLAGPPRGLLLDLATGTGDLALELARFPATTVVGVDFSAPMLEAARVKLWAQGRRAEIAQRPPPPSSSRVRLVQADALALPFADQTFDGVTSAFLLRNLADLDAGLAEMRRVLKEGGWLVTLDITRPRGGAVATVANWCFARLVPVLGGVLTGQWAAYRYLPASVGAFLDPEALAARLRQAGFRDLRSIQRGLGLISIHLGRR